MADQKISALPPFTGQSVLDDDQFIINDSSSGSYETKRISFSQLAGTVGGTSGAQYLTFFQGSDVNTTDNGISINNDGWWASLSPDKSPVEIGSETKTFIAPAGSIGALILFSSRMAHELSDNVQDMALFDTGSEFNMKCWANCRQTTPDCYWNTRAQPNQNVNGFAQRLITTVAPNSTNKDFQFQTYHSAKWDYVDWATGASDQDRTFSYTVQWFIDELGWSRVNVGMNRVIILPMYEDPQVSAFNVGDYVDPFVQISNGVMPSEYTVRLDQVDQLDAAMNTLTAAQGDEVTERAYIYKTAMDKIQRNADGYIMQYTGSQEQDIIDNIASLQAIITELYDLKTSNALIDVVEKHIYGDKTATQGTAEYLGLYGRTAKIVGFYWQFDNSRGPSF